MRALLGMMVLLPLVVGCGGDEDKGAGSDTGSAARTESDADSDIDSDIDTGLYVEPSATLDRIDLVDHPTARDLGRWACHNLDVDFEAIIDGLLSSDPDWVRAEYCPNAINKTKLLFSFVLHFDLVNNDESNPISLTEIHLATALYEDESFGAVCVQFCEPDADDCTPTMNALDACDLESAVAVNDPAYLTPTVDGLLQLAAQVVAGNSENGESRVIPPAETIQASIQFDIDIDTMLELSADHLMAIVADLVNNNPTSMSVPYTMKGNLFFRLPSDEMYATGFGPFEATWHL